MGKTELELSILKRCRIVVEYFDQSLIEGEIQRLNKKEAKKLIHAELYELVSNKKIGRKNNKEITLFDSVGIALEDYSALKFTFELAKKYNIGKEVNLTPVLNNPKNLISLLG